MERSATGCPVCTGAPVVVVAVDHHALRRLVLELLEQDGVPWQLHAVADRQDLAAVVSAARPDLVVLADGDLGRCIELLSIVAPPRVIVMGPEPGRAYESAARRAGADAWLSTDRIGEDLIVNMRRVLGCTHGPVQSAA